MKQDNRGLSLVELIVVIAIMAVLIGVGILSLSLLFGTQARGCAQNVSSMLSETKTGCLSRYDETMTLSYRTKGPDEDTAITSDGYYAENCIYTIGKEDEKVKSILIGGTGSSEIRRMGNKNVIITVHLSDGTYFELGTANSVTIRYNRSTGAFDYVMVNNAPTSNYIEKMTFSSGLKTYTITMFQETGKHTIQG